MVLDLDKIVKENKRLKEKKSKKKKSTLLKKLSKKLSGKKILKKSKATIVLHTKEPAEYVSRYFKDEMQETKRSMFLE